MAKLEYFSTGTKIMGNHSKFYFSPLKPQENTLLFFIATPVYGAMNVSGTPLLMMLKSPSFYQWANCQV